MIDPTKFRRKLSDLADAREGLGAAKQRNLPAGANTDGQRDVLRMVEELKPLAKMLASLNEGSDTVH